MPNNWSVLYRNFSRSPKVKKKEFIIKHIVQKKVLDLGIVAHDLNNYRQNLDTWLHWHVVKNAKYVLGLDILENEIRILKEEGFNVICADASEFKSTQLFEAAICGDLIEHVDNPGTLLRNIYANLSDDGILIVTTPSPFAISRIMNLLFDKSTSINEEHICWFCPQTLLQLGERCGFYIHDFSWLDTEFSMPTVHRLWKYIASFASTLINKNNNIFSNDFGIVFKKKSIIRIEPYRVSIILPTHNRSSMAIDACEDFLKQNYPLDRFELIIVDNCSEEKEKQKLLNYLNNVKSELNIKYYYESRPGLVYARHTGSILASGEILLFGDDDAHYEANWIEAVIECFRLRPEVKAVGTKILIQWDSTPPDWVIKYESLLGKLVYKGNIVSDIGLYINGGSFAIKKEILFEMEGFNPGQLGKYIVGDSEVGLCNKLANKSYYVGWTALTVMYHRQLVKKNATNTDIKRRYWNNGICAAYTDTFKKNAPYGKFKLYTIKPLLLGYRIIKILIESRSTIEENKYYRILNLFSNLLYIFRYKLDPFLIKKIKSKSWKLDKNYTIDTQRLIEFRSNTR